MKKQNDIRTLLGLKQEDIAMLLDVTRAHWGMYEIGKRDLPTAAMQKLSEILVHVQSHDRVIKPQPDKKSIARYQQQLTELVDQNEFQRLLLAKKITAATKKLVAQQRMSLLVDFIGSQEGKGSKSDNIYQYVLRKQAQNAHTDYESILMQYELKKEVLEFEQKLIESKMKQ